MNSSVQPLDQNTERAVRTFLTKASLQFPVRAALLFGSRARGTSGPESDVDLAIVLSGLRSRRRRVDEALKMADIAFDVLLETGLLIEAIPLWEEEWEHPETFNNPTLLENIRREGIPV